MAKKVYKFLSYPESSNVDEIETALNSVGFSWVHSQVHDKDVNADQLPKKPHFHWLVGFEKNPPSYTELKRFISELGGVLPPARDAVEKYVDDAIKYMPHDTENARAQGKAQYGEPVFSDSWDTDNFTTYTDKRAAKSAAASVEIGEVLALLKDHRLFSTRQACDWLCENRPELLSVYASKTYFFEHYFTGLLAEEKALAEAHDRIEQLELQLAHAFDMQEDSEAQAFRLCQNLRTYYQRITGESVSFSDLSLKTAEHLVLTLLERG